MPLPLATPALPLAVQALSMLSQRPAPRQMQL